MFVNSKFTTSYDHVTFVLVTTQYIPLQIHAKILIKQYILMNWYSRKTIPNCINWYLTIGGNKCTLCSRKCWAAGKHKPNITCEIPCLTIHNTQFWFTNRNYFWIALYTSISNKNLIWFLKSVHRRDKKSRLTHIFQCY